MQRTRGITNKYVESSSGSEAEEEKSQNVSSTKKNKSVTLKSNIQSKESDSSSESDIETYLRNPDKLDLDSEFFQTNPNKSQEQVPDFDAVEKEIFSGVTRLSESDSDSDDDSFDKRKKTLVKSKKKKIPKTKSDTKKIDLHISHGKLSESDSEKSETTSKPKNKSKRKTKPKDAASSSTQSFNQLQEYTKQIEEAKRFVEIYKAKKQAKENQTDILNLLAAGEGITSTNQQLNSTELHSSDFESCDSEQEDWEEIKQKDEQQGDEKKQLPNKNVEITLSLPGAVKKKKGVDLLAAMKRRLNRIRKENQVLIHKVHLLCYIAHGNYLNKALNNTQTLGMALSLLPSEQCYPADRTDLSYLEQIVSWYKRTIKCVDKSVPDYVPLETLLQMQINKKEVYNKKMLVLIFIAILRSLGIQCRLVMSLQVEPLRPPASELHSLSIKPEKEKKMQKINENNESSSSKNEETSLTKNLKDVKQPVSNKKDLKIDNVKSRASREEKVLKSEKNQQLRVSTTKTRPKSKSPKPRNTKESTEEKEALKTSVKSTSSNTKDTKQNLKVETAKAITRTTSPRPKNKEKDENNTNLKTRTNSTSSNSKVAKQNLKVDTTKARAKSTSSTTNLQETIRDEEIKHKKTRNAKAKAVNAKQDSDAKNKTAKESVGETNTKSGTDIQFKQRTTRTEKAKTTKTENELKLPGSSRRSKSAEILLTAPDDVAKCTCKDVLKSKNFDKGKLKPSLTTKKSKSTERLENEAKCAKCDNRSSKQQKGSKGITNCDDNTRNKNKPSECPTQSVNTNGKSSTKSINKTKIIKLKPPVPQKKVPQVDGLGYSSDEEDFSYNFFDPLSVGDSDYETNILHLFGLACLSETKLKRFSSFDKEHYSYPFDEMYSSDFSTSSEDFSNLLIPQVDGPSGPSSISRKKPNLKVLAAGTPPVFKTNKSVRFPSKQLDVRNDIIGLIKGRIAERKEIDKSRIVKKRTSGPLSDSDSDYAPSPVKKKHQLNSDSEDEFKPKVKVKRRIPSKGALLEQAEEEKKKKIGNDFWVEVFLESEEKWICADLVYGQVHCVKEVCKRATQPVSYVLAWNNNNTIKDVTQRYCQNFNTVTRKLRIDAKWWNETMKPYIGKPSARDKEEDNDLARQQLDQPLPKSIAEYKNHPLYVLKRHLLKFEALYPPDPPTLGFVRGEAVYPRGCVFTLHSRDIWLKSAKVVKLGEKPYKIVKARPKWDRLSNALINDQMLEIFGSWQVEDYVPPNAENGKVPRNAFGNVDLFKPCMIPGGCVHLKLPGLNKIARKLNIDCASAIVGFDFHGGWSHPTYDGFIVCKEFEDVLINAWEEEQLEIERKEQEKIEKRVYDNWKRLIKGLLIRERLKARYDFGQPSGSGTSQDKKRKSKAPTFATKKRRVHSNKHQSESDGDDEANIMSDDESEEDIL